MAITLQGLTSLFAPQVSPTQGAEQFSRGLAGMRDQWRINEQRRANAADEEHAAAMLEHSRNVLAETIRRNRSDEEIRQAQNDLNRAKAEYDAVKTGMGMAMSGTPPEAVDAMMRPLGASLSPVYGPPPQGMVEAPPTPEPMAEPTDPIAMAQQERLKTTDGRVPSAMEAIRRPMSLSGPLPTIDEGFGEPPVPDNQLTGEGRFLADEFVRPGEESEVFTLGDVDKAEAFDPDSFYSSKTDPLSPSRVKELDAETAPGGDLDQYLAEQAEGALDEPAQPPPPTITGYQFSTGGGPIDFQGMQKAQKDRAFAVMQSLAKSSDPRHRAIWEQSQSAVRELTEAYGMNAGAATEFAIKEIVMPQLRNEAMAQGRALSQRGTQERFDTGQDRMLRREARNEIRNIVKDAEMDKTVTGWVAAKRAKDTIDEAIRTGNGALWMEAVYGVAKAREGGRLTNQDIENVPGLASLLDELQHLTARSFMGEAGKAKRENVRNMIEQMNRVLSARALKEYEGLRQVRDQMDTDVERRSADRYLQGLYSHVADWWSAAREEERAEEPAGDFQPEAEDPLEAMEGKYGGR